MSQVILPDISGHIAILESVSDKLMEQYMNFENVIITERCTESDNHTVSGGFIGE